VIAYLQGTLKTISEDRLTLLVNGIGYEVLIPAFAMMELRGSTQIDTPLSLYISFNQTERQPKPILVGFPTAVDKEFFELFISVEDIGPAAAIKALVKPAREIAGYIEEKNIKALKQLRGIGERKAEKIVATLKGKVAKYALIREAPLRTEALDDFKKEVGNVLVLQLGYKQAEAKKMIEEAMQRNPRITTSEELFDEVYRGQKK
jgi:Holliday junction DNA helicase RuvA